MKILISPAKSLELKSSMPTQRVTKPKFIKEAIFINSLLREKSPKSLKELMSISEKLADINWKRNQNFANSEIDQQNSRAAIYTFIGDVYKGLDPYNLPKEKIDQMQSQLRILSGLYGILKPLDQIQPYRLEMGTKINIGSSKNLYSFWKNKITTQLKSELKEAELIVNLASREYFSAIDTDLLDNRIVSPEFKDFKNGNLKIISFFAKKARGMMARHLINLSASNIEDILSFSVDGYKYSSEDTIDDMHPIFIR